MSVTRGVVSRVEKRDDMPYSTLLGCLRAAGMEDVALTSTVRRRRVEIVLADVEGDRRVRHSDSRHDRARGPGGIDTLQDADLPAAH